MLISNLIKPKLVCYGLLFLFATLSLSGCKDDDDKSIMLGGELTAADLTYSLNDARILFKGDGVTEGGNPFAYKRYFITDGEIVSGNGFAKDHYENATYFIMVQIGIPNGNEWATGEFPQYRNWSSTPAESNTAFLTSNFDWDIDRYFVTHSSENTPLVVSGGLDPGDRISITFSGNIQYERMGEDGETWLVTNEPCTFNFTGKVVDDRAIN